MHDNPPHETTGIVIAGAGPAGLTLAAELARAAIPALILEQEPEPPRHPRGFNLNARSLELLHRRGLTPRLLTEGPTTPTTMFVGASRLHLDAMHTAHPYALGIAQTRVEEILTEHALASGAQLHRSRRLTALHHDHHGITAHIDTPTGPTTIHAQWIVGCDGARSTVRKAAAIPFPGTPARTYTLLGDVTLADPTALHPGPNTGPHGHTVLAIPRPGHLRLLTTDTAPPTDPHQPVTLTTFQHAIDTALGRHTPITRAHWLTRFGDAARLAQHLRTGRILLAGDAAHIHPPAGAIGVNTAIDDALNLGWKLALVAHGHAPHTLLDTYHHERHTAGTRLLRNTLAQAALARTGDDPRLNAVRDLLAELADNPATAGPVAETLTGIDTRYPSTGSPHHPWAGRLVPDIPLEHSTLTTLLTRTTGGALLLDPATAPHPLTDTTHPWADRITTARTHALDGTRAVLVRPDGHAAWIDEPSTPTATTTAELHQALTHWFGHPAPPPPARVRI